MSYEPSRARRWIDMVRTSTRRTDPSKRDATAPAPASNVATKKPADNAVIVFARSNHGASSIEQQIDQLRGYATRHGYRVVGTVGLPHTSANDPKIESVVAGLIAQRSAEPHTNALLMTDLSRLSRDVHCGVALMHRLRSAGWEIIVAGQIGNAMPSELGPEIFTGEKVNMASNAKQKEGRGSADAKVDVGGGSKGFRETVDRARLGTGRARIATKERKQ